MCNLQTQKGQGEFEFVQPTNEMADSKMGMISVMKRGLYVIDAIETAGLALTSTKPMPKTCLSGPVLA
jgi:hypothetical protein